ncbi:S9 family peptidase [Desertivirga arenae]|uniref:S9 family peptidase n=1 Tax=Desertivirga arenae TaxID=2810309 RepID=UPI001A95BA13|nr:S9 family peptidase [Pedobacter sp. SYSU D00823]
MQKLTVYRAIGFAFLFQLFSSNLLLAQAVRWTLDNKGIYEVSDNNIIVRDISGAVSNVIVKKSDLIPAGTSRPLEIKNFAFSANRSLILISTNTRKVWRYETRGDYWVMDLKTKRLFQIGKALPEASLMFAKFSPDASKVAYVSGHNLYCEELSNGKITALTKDGSSKIINGTFDWVYEEEFDCRDGFRWSDNSKSIAFWKLDAGKTRNYLMLNTTDSIYSRTIPVEYPKAGEDPSKCSIAVVNIATGETTLMDIPGDPVQNYIPRMEWAASSDQIILQQLNREQNLSNIIICDVNGGNSKVIYTETDPAWIDVKARWSEDPTGWDWINKGKEFLWVSEKDGWRHIYRVDREGKEKLITRGDYDMISLSLVDEPNGYIYYMASPDNATESYLYRTRLDGNGNAEKVTPQSLKGSHSYQISDKGKFAIHRFSNASTLPGQEIVSLADHKNMSGKLNAAEASAASPEFFKIKTAEGVEMDGWMLKPTDFNPKKKYPVLFYVYGEPASQTVTNRYGAGRNRLYKGSMANDGYIYISLENRGAPAPKGRTWRKSIYKSIGTVNIRDQAMAAKEILKWSFIDSSRVAVWGWSGGGSSTLNLMFQYPEIYKTGIAIAAVASQFTYDNIYQERYMGNPKQDSTPYLKGSPLTYARNLKGNLLYIHGTGDDNVHYQNAELLINELVKYNKQFEMMAYPNRTHSISEGAGTTEHLATLFTEFLKKHCPPGGR